MSDDILTFDEMISGVQVANVANEYTLLAAFLGALLAASCRTYIPFYIRKMQGKITWNEFDPRYIGAGIFAAIIGTFGALESAPDGSGYFTLAFVGFMVAYASNTILNKPG